MFYSRDSGGKHENTPAQYIDWARRQAESLGVAFNGTGEQIERMTRSGVAVEGDVFWDYGVSGEKLSRKGLDAFLKEALSDLEVSHVFIPRRDRFARPEDPFDAVKLENTLRHAGITVVFMDRTCAPIIRGQKRDIGDMITSLLDYNYSGEYVQELAQKVVYAQIHLAKSGYSTGGRAPYGFRRNLVNGNGTVVRQLGDGEHVKMAGHHVVWLPGPDEEIAVILRIIELIDSMPASRVAALLTAEGVPTPDIERLRTDGGVRHRTSGVWHQPTVVNIARNPLNKALMVYGKRSMGRMQRYTPAGPRPLDDGEFLVGDKKKVVRNSDANTIVASAAFKPLVDRSNTTSCLRSWTRAPAPKKESRVRGSRIKIRSVAACSTWRARGQCIALPLPLAFVTSAVFISRVTAFRALTIGSTVSKRRASSLTPRANVCRNPESKTAFVCNF